MIVSSNPYASPTEAGNAASSVDFRDIFVGWERLRILYNLLLLPIALLCGIGSFADTSFWDRSFSLAIGVNICFGAGHVLEGYAALVFPKQSRFLRIPLFALGVFASVPLTIVVLPPVWLFGGMFGSS